MSTSGMGDAVRDGDVHAADLEDTIDAASPQDAASPPAGLPAAIVAATRDHTELLEVDRSHYAITRELARGGIGRVFEARDLRLGRAVAIKELLPKNRDAARRFEREARITARLQHPAIIHVHEAGVWPGGEPFYAMPLVSGRSLDKVVAERKTLDERIGLLPNVIAVADALAYAHNANVIHRDLKPANVLVGDFGETVVIDWGLAKDLGAHSDPKESLQMRLRATAEETASGSVVGTPAYMPPEQARGDAVDQRADVYALGALLYKVLCGASPYDGTSGHDVLEQVKRGPPVPVHKREPGAPPDLVAIVAKAMARDPDRRYITASELAQDLKRFQTGQLVGAHRYTRSELLRRWLRRHRVAVVIAAVATIVLAVTGVLALRSIFDEKRQADAARDYAQDLSNQASVGRINLLEEKARTLLDKNAAHALAYLIGAQAVEAEQSFAAQLETGGARGFMIADAMAPFEAEEENALVGKGNVVVATSPDGMWIAAAGNGPIRLLASDGTELQKLGPFGTTRIVAFDATSTRMVAAGDDKLVRIWSLDRLRKDAHLIATLPGHSGPINDVVFSHDGRLLATASDDTSVRIWNLQAGTNHDVDCHGEPVVSVRFSPNDEKVLSASTDFSACVIAFRNSLPFPWVVERQIRGHTARLNSAEWSRDGQFIVTASDDGTARVWSNAKGKPVYRDPLRHDAGTVVNRALVTRDGSIISAGSDLTVRIWELPATVPKEGATPPPAKREKKLEGHTGQIVAAALSADEHYLATGGFDGLVKIWDLRTRQQVRTFEPGQRVTSLAFVPGARLRLVTGSADGVARIWNAERGKRSLDLGYAVNAIAVASDGTVAAGLGESSVRMVRPRQTEAIDLHGHLGVINAVVFTNDGQLISAGEDAAAFVWDVRTGTKVGELARTALDPPPPIHALAILPPVAGDERKRVALLREGKIEIWSRATGEAAARKPEQILDAEGVIEAFAVDPMTGTIVGVGQRGTFAVWDRYGVIRHAPSKRDVSYNAVAFAPDGRAIVGAGPGFARVFVLDDPGIAARAFGVDDRAIGDVEITLDPSEDIGVVRAVAFSADSSLVITAGDRGRALIWDAHKGKLLAGRDRHDATISALAVHAAPEGHDGTLWVASEDNMISEWSLRVETRPLGWLQAFMREHVPVTLKDDVILRVEDAGGKQAP